MTGHVEGVDPVSAVEVIASEEGMGGVLVTTTTDARGRFSVEGMPAGPARAIVRSRSEGAVAVIDP